MSTRERIEHIRKQLACLPPDDQIEPVVDTWGIAHIGWLSPGGFRMLPVDQEQAQFFAAAPATIRWLLATLESVGWPELPPAEPEPDPAAYDWFTLAQHPPAEWSSERLIAVTGGALRATLLERIRSLEQQGRVPGAIVLGVEPADFLLDYLKLRGDCCWQDTLTLDGCDYLGLPVAVVCDPYLVRVV